MKKIKKESLEDFVCTLLDDWIFPIGFVIAVIYFFKLIMGQ